MPDLQLGLHTFGDVTADAAGVLLPQAQVIRDVVAEGVLADQVGLDFFGVGEHHREDFAVSAPDVVLAAIAGQTRTHPAGIRRHRAELGRPRARLRALLDARRRLGRPRRGDPRARLLHRVVPALRLRPRRLRAAVRGEAGAVRASCSRSGPVTWSGETRAALHDQTVYPPLESGALRTWIAVGGTPESVVRAAHYGFPLMLAIIGGEPMRFAPYVDLYQRALARVRTGRRRRSACTRTATSPRTDEQALDESWPHYARDARQDRPRARLAADDPGAVRGRRRARRRAVRRLARDRGGEDRQGRARASASRAST